MSIFMNSAMMKLKLIAKLLNKKSDGQKLDGCVLARKYLSS